MFLLQLFYSSRRSIIAASSNTPSNCLIFYSTFSFFLLVWIFCCFLPFHPFLISLFVWELAYRSAMDQFLGLVKTIPAPSIDRPFGIHLWPLFSKSFEVVIGYSADDFRFVQGVTPISTLKEATAALVSYYAIILGGRELMRPFGAFTLKPLFILHNLICTVFSGVLLALFIEQLLPTLWNHGVFYAICRINGGWTQPLITLYYLNYLNKYLEFFDTLFLVLKKKPLTFLHTYHHGATALLCYTQLIGSTAVSWVPITLNLTVHVVMYWYYFQSARGIRIWWKQYITILQIVQFVIDLGILCPHCI